MEQEKLMNNIIYKSLYRKRKVEPSYFTCEELHFTKDKEYEVYAISNEGTRYINEYVFKLKNDNGAFIRVDMYSIGEVPKFFHKLFIRRNTKPYFKSFKAGRRTFIFK